MGKSLAPVDGSVTVPRYTATEAKIMAVLKDRKPHSARILHRCLWDEMGSLHNLHMHISNIRRKIAPAQDILCRRGYYRLVTLP